MRLSIAVSKVSNNESQSFKPDLKKNKTPYWWTTSTNLYLNLQNWQITTDILFWSLLSSTTFHYPKTSCIDFITDKNNFLVDWQQSTATTKETQKQQHKARIWFIDPTLECQNYQFSEYLAMKQDPNRDMVFQY